VNQQVEHLRLHCHQFTAPAQLATIGVQDVIIKVEFHVRYRTFLKKQSSQSHEEIKRQAKPRRHFPCTLSKSEVAIPFPRSGVHFMTEAQAIRPAVPSNRTLRFTAFLFGGVAYLTFLFTILYAIGFVSGLVVPKGIDTGANSGMLEAIVVNLALMSLFAIQHSVMARKSFKHWWTQFIPRSVERSTYVLCASLTLLLLFWQWRPMPSVVWDVQEPEMAMVIATLSFVGWVIVFTSTFMINHFELFGLHQVANNLVGREMPEPVFRTPFFYRFVRHPIYLGFVIAFWATPTMSAGHLLFAAVTTAYIFVGIMLEERDLVGMFGDEYRRYREHVSMLFPWRKLN
jgi:protein-S-isoprenylcysteine O-methyltransferase Ste14